MIIAVDGPAGSGKSSVCAKVCDRIGWTYVNTGFLYRSIAVLAMEQGVDLESEDALCGVVDEFSRAYHWDPVTGQLKIGSRDLTSMLQTNQASAVASSIAKMPKVRNRLLPIQRHLSLLAPNGAIVDGRDIGTVVFPDANLKIFLTASLEERAKRRKSQLEKTTGKQYDLKQIMDDIAQRDNQDQSRQFAPLKQASDALTIDTSSMDVDDVVETIVNILRSRAIVQ